MGGAFVGLTLTPVLAQASTFSFLASLFGNTAQASITENQDPNSQTVPLLAAATNLDPNPSIGGGNISVIDGALVAQEGPAGTASDVAERPSSSQISVYVVRDGDTLSGIAAMFDVSINTIIWANNIQKGVIHPGETLVILPVTGIQHTVTKGETLASLAKTYGSDAADIASFNNLPADAALTVGESVIIPDGELASSGPASSASKTSSSSKSSSALSRISNSTAPTAPLRGLSNLDEGNYYAWPLKTCIETQGLHGFDAVDLGAPKGTPIYAAAGGLIIVANNSGGWNGGYGNYVVIAHGNGTQTLYAHMSKVLATVGSQVGQGDEIGLVGATGEATGPHLHFEVRGAKNPFDLGVGTRCGA